MYDFKINQKRFTSDEPQINGLKLLTIANLEPPEDYELLYKINEKGFTPIQLDEEVDLRTVGIEGFRARPYKKLIIKVDDKEIEVEECFMTPLEILELAGLNPDRYFLKETRNGGLEVTYKDDIEHRIAIKRNSYFTSCEIEVVIECVIVEGQRKDWSKDTISFEEVVVLAFGSISTKPYIIYTVTYINGVPSKPEGSMLPGDVISVNNKMIFNVSQTDKS